MSLMQLIAVRNTINESLEIARWIEISKGNLELVEKEMIALVNRLYPKLSYRGRKFQEKAMTAVRSSGEVMKVPINEVKKLTNKIHYAIYEGHCLDPKGLSYFIPEKTIEEGVLTFEEVKKILSE